MIHYLYGRQWGVDNDQRITQQLSLDDSLSSLKVEARLSLPIDVPDTIRNMSLRALAP